MWWNTGDTHGEYSTDKLSMKKWPKQKEYDWTKDDVVCILGDFGHFWMAQQTKQEKYWLDWLRDRPYTIVFVDGNHENFDRINKFDEVDFLGGKAGQAWDGIYHLKRGQIYTYQGKRIFTFGGAASHDKQIRRLGIDLWREEEPSYAEIDFALSQLHSINYTVDYILTHTFPKTVIRSFGAIGSDYLKCATAEFLENVLERANFKRWYCGHFHVDVPMDRFYAMYYDIERMI